MERVQRIEIMKLGFAYVTSNHEAWLQFFTYLKVAKASVSVCRAQSLEYDDIAGHFS